MVFEALAQLTVMILHLWNIGFKASVFREVGFEGGRQIFRNGCLCRGHVPAEKAAGEVVSSMMSTAGWLPDCADAGF